MLIGIGAELMGFQANVVDSIPGNPNYTPLWKVSIVEWKTTNGTTPTILGSDDPIGAAKGPILQWGGNKDNTISAGHI